MRKNHTKIISKKDKSINLLVFRFSSMGDVALTAPVLKGLLVQNRHLRITMVTRPLYAPFFEGFPRLELFLCDFKKEFAGLRGIIRLFTKLKSGRRFDSVVDLHGVLRTRILDLLFRSAGIPVRTIDKGRRDKKKLIRGKLFKPLKNTVDRYLDVFEGLDLKFSYPPKPVLNIGEENLREAENFIRKHGLAGKTLAGIAPFSLHVLKTWPIAHTEHLIRKFEERDDVVIFLFGGSEEEIRKLEDLSRGYGRRINLAGNFSFGTQLAFISKMKFMVTMDSANMHLASLLGIPAITLWGATHPFAGFSAYMQHEDNNIQIGKEELPCRPCTVFGAGSCRRGDFACMQWLTPDLVYNRISRLNLI